VSTATPATAIFRIRMSRVPFRWSRHPLSGAAEECCAPQRTSGGRAGEVTNS
jgi:hypothetical protein